MIALKVEKVGDRVVVELTEEALAALETEVGATVHLEPSPGGVLRQVTREVWMEDGTVPGRAVLRGAERAFERYEG